MKKLSFEQSAVAPKISQWFISLEGEGNSIGEPSLYLRLAGCYSAACSFCDTKFSWDAAPSYRQFDDRTLLLDMAKELEKVSPDRLTITGGEPLHFMEWFPDIFRTADSVNFKHFEFLGIESNGNLLSDEKNCLSLIKSFNEIIHDLGVTPTLTISPKINATSCYEDQLTQAEVNTMYFNVFNNVNSYLRQYNVFYKFIYDYTDESISFNTTLMFIKYLTEELNISKKNIILMPFTPDDPLGKDNEIWKKSMDATSRKALSLGVTYSPRIHIDRQLD